MDVNRLSSLDVAFLCLERPATPMHLGAVAVFRPAGRVNPIRLVDVLARRAARVPRLRQRVRPTWRPPGGAVWTDDPAFDVARHIRLHRLPGWPIGDRFGAAVSAAMARPLDLSRPLWEVHVFAGLADGRFAVLTKLHHALADGLRAVELGVALLDEAAPAGSAAAPAGAGTAGAGTAGVGTAGVGTAGAGTAARTATIAAGPPGAPSAGAPGWVRPALRTARTAGTALVRPDRLVRPAATAAAGLPGLARQTGQVLGIATSLVRSMAPPAPHSPVAASTSAERRLALVRIDLRDVYQIRRRHGGTVHDVLLAVLTGALRQWLRQRGHPLDGATLRALIPVGERRRPADRAGGNQLSGYRCDLPVGEPDPLTMLRAVRAEMDRRKAAGAGRGAGAVSVLAGRLPPAVHRLAAPFAGRGAQLLFDTVVTSVPLPNVPLSLAGAELAEVYPIVPLADGHALGIAVSTYRRTAYLTLHADPRAVPDLGGLAATVPTALSMLARLPRAS